MALALPDEGEFVARVKAFLEANAAPLPPRETRWGVGDDAVVDQDESDEEEAAAFERARAWRRALTDAGFGWITGPTDWGGAGLPRRYQELFDTVAGHYEVPNHVSFIVGLHIVAPTIEVHGTDEAKERYLRALYRGDVIGCQLFSEPDAGSDLAGVKTRGVRDGDGWRITGQKVWTSGAHHADIGEVLVRTDPDASKHAGLSMMLVDMHAPGVTVRPLRQITGSAEFNEVFLDDVFVPDRDVLAAPGQGWAVAMTTLGSERESMGSRDDAERDPVQRLVQLAQHTGRAGDPVIRQQVADVVIRNRVTQWTAERYASGAVTPQPAVIKLLMTNKLQAISHTAGELLGPKLVADTGEWGTYAWAGMVLGVPSHRIAGGTDEIMRNVIAERLLGLPRDPKP
jgi:alkylation response protein AidB-like acyl-CoA dehydrogenase